MRWAGSAKRGRWAGRLAPENLGLRVWAGAQAAWVRRGWHGETSVGTGCGQPLLLRLSPARRLCSAPAHQWEPSLGREAVVLGQLRDRGSQHCLVAQRGLMSITITTWASFHVLPHQEAQPSLTPTLPSLALVPESQSSEGVPPLLCTTAGPRPSPGMLPGTLQTAATARLPRSVVLFTHQTRPKSLTDREGLWLPSGHLPACPFTHRLEANCVL